MMKKAGLFVAALFSGAALCLSAPAGSALAQGTATVIVKPVRNWQEPPIQDLTGQGGKVVRKVCAIESRFDNEVLMAVLRNRDDEYALRMFFPTLMFSPGVIYPITLVSGDEGGEFNAVPVYPGTILVELGRDDALLKSYSETGSLKLSLSKNEYEFKSGDLDAGMDLLMACADTLGAAVSSAGVAGPLPTVPQSTGGSAMAMPPSVARIDAPSRVELADLGSSDNTASTGGQGHVQEQMIFKPLKDDGAAVADATVSETPKTGAEVKEEVEKSGFSLFSIFGDVDESEIDGPPPGITAEKHYTPKTDAIPAIQPVQTSTLEDMPAEPVKEMAEGSVEAVTEKVASEDVVVEDAPEMPETQPANSTGDVVAEAEIPEMQAMSTPQPKAKPDDGRMIVWDDEMETPPVRESMSAVQGEAQDEVQNHTAAIASDTAPDLENRLEKLEERLSAEVARNRQLEMQLRDMAAKPVSANASIDLSDTSSPAEPMESMAPSTVQDRVAVARQERAEMKHNILNQRQETLSGLLQQAGVRPVASPAPEGDLDSANTAFSWHTGEFYGGAEFGAKPRDIEFSSLVSAYLDATGQRCEGDFASHLERIETRATGSIATAELVCVGHNADTAAAVVFYEDSQTFGVISHEGSSDELSTAIRIRDSIASAIDGKL